MFNYKVIVKVYNFSFLILMSGLPKLVITFLAKHLNVFASLWLEGIACSNALYRICVPLP